MHKTAAGEKRKALKKSALELERHAKALARAKEMEPARKAHQKEADSLNAEAKAVKCQARLKDQQIWKMEKEKTSQEGSKTFITGWPNGVRAPGVRNVHLGSCRKMEAEAEGQRDDS